MRSVSAPEKKLHKPNHLANEKSPYLQQHAYNPVDWYPWGDEAFRRAGDEHKPVFLSIGYSTCHWCHVMARESFENDDIANLLNNNFIAIKVDREERPDIDSVYMTACQQMTGQGGWPLTIIMLPDKQPFFAGTYLPATGRAGMTGLDDLLNKIILLWKDRQELLEDAAGQLTNALEKTRAIPASGTPGELLLHDGYEELAASFDPANGGFSGAPKFPVPATLLFMLRYWKRTGEIRARMMAEKTLEAMLCGGIHDHIGGGFHRYSTDARWRVPHFEKMLYDQALLLMAFTNAWQATKKTVYKKTAESIVAYVLRDLSAPEGAFFSAEDADSPGGEGAFYLWSMEEFSSVLGPEESRYAAMVFGVTGSGNLREGDGSGKSILYRTNGCPEHPAD